MAGRESDGHVLEYVHSSSSLSKIRSFVWLFLFPFFFFCGSTNSIVLNNALSPPFFPTHFYPWAFLCCCCRAVFAHAGAFNGDLSTWQVGKVTDMAGSTYTLSPHPLQDRVFFCWLFLFSLLLSLSALILFLNNALSSFFSNPFLSLDFSLLLWCSV